jgi:hypothetical protein
VLSAYQALSTQHSRSRKEGFSHRGDRVHEIINRIVSSMRAISTHALCYFSLQYEPLYRTPSTGLPAMKCSSPECLIRVKRIYSGEEREGLVRHCKLRTETMRNSRFELIDETVTCGSPAQIPGRLTATSVCGLFQCD